MDWYSNVEPIGRRLIASVQESIYSIYVISCSVSLSNIVTQVFLKSRQNRRPHPQDLGMRLHDRLVETGTRIFIF